MRKAALRAAASPLREEQPPDVVASHTPSPEVAASLSQLGSAIAQLGRNESGTSLVSDASAETGQAVVQAVSTRRETLTMKQVVTSVIGLRTGPVQCFKVKDDLRRRRYKVLFPGDVGIRGGGDARPEFLVVDGAGRAVWSVRGGTANVSKILVKPGSDYHIALVRKHWVSYLNKLVEGVAYRYGKERVVFVVRGDALGRRFSIYAQKALIAQAHRGTKIAQPGKNVMLTVANLSSTHFTVATWTLSVEPGVDTALMTAIMATLEKWTVEARYVGKKDVAEKIAYGHVLAGGRPSLDQTGMDHASEGSSSTANARR